MKKSKLIDELEYAAIDAHVGFLLWEKWDDIHPLYNKEWNDCTVKECVRRRKLLIKARASLNEEN